MNKRALVTTLLAGVFAGSIVFAGQVASKRLTIKGSDTMVILAQRWAESFMKKNPESSIQVTGGGSGTGFAALINGTTDLCNASRSIKESEIKKIEARFGCKPHEIKTAIDGITIYVHESNPVKELSLGQLKAIFTGGVKNWKEVGGPEGAIIMYGRDNSSGTFEFFREHVLEKADFAANVQGMPGTAAVVHAVSKDPKGIGYGGAAYGKGVKFVAVRKSDTAKAVEPLSAAIRSGEYPIARYLYFYSVKKPEGLMKQFVDWVLSPDGQKVVEGVGYFPL